MEFQTLYQELKNSTEMIRTLLAGLNQEEACAKPGADSWSILEVTCHLYDEEREDFREHLDFILHRQDEEYHVIDPQNWVKERRYNEQDFQAMQARFFSERQKSGEMFACWVAHDNLHIRQLVELRRARIENVTQPYPLEYAGDW